HSQDDQIHPDRDAKNGPAGSHAIGFPFHGRGMLSCDGFRTSHSGRRLTRGTRTGGGKSRRTALVRVPAGRRAAMGSAEHGHPPSSSNRPGALASCRPLCRSAKSTSCRSTTIGRGSEWVREGQLLTRKTRRVTYPCRMKAGLGALLGESPLIIAIRTQVAEL